MARTYYVCYQSPHSTRSYPYGSYEQARMALAKFTSAFAREGAEVMEHNDNYASLKANTAKGIIPFTFTIYNK